VVGHRVPLTRLRRRWFWTRCYWGARGEARIVPESQLSGYELLRSTWHLGRAQWQALCGLGGHGPWSEEFFYHTRVLAFRLGYWVGLVQRVGGRLRPGPAGRPVPSGSVP